MSTTHLVTIGVDGQGAGLTIRTESPDHDVTRLLASMTPPIRVRRRGRDLLLSIEDASRLVSPPAGLQVEWDSSARRIAENRLQVAERAPSVIEEARRIQSSEIDSVRRRISDGHLTALLDGHQAINVAVMTIPGSWGTCIFDEQGTGKTVTTIAAFDLLVERGEANVLLVVAPKSMVGEWVSEFRRFAGDLYGLALADGDRASKLAAIEAGADVIVTNYETAISLLPNLRLLARRCRLVLAVDESYAVKNPDAQRTQALMELREWCSRAYVLCGTPAPNHARDIVSQFDLVDFGFTFQGVKLDADPTTAFNQVRAAMESRGVYTRNLKRVVLPHLPDRVFTEVGVSLAPQQRHAYETALDDLILDLRKVSDADYQRRIGSFLERRITLLRICSNPGPVIPGYDETPAKLEALDRVLSELIEDREEKVVLWSFFRASLDAVAARYARYGVSRVDGSIGDVSARREAVRRFQEDDETMLFIGNPAAAGAGLTLHRSRVAVYESLSNQAAHFLQSLDRIHRRGQEREVEYLTLLCSGTIEEREYARLLDKADAQADLLGDPPDPWPTRELFLDELLDAKRLLGGMS